MPHQCPSRSALKIDTREATGSIPDCACLPSRSEFTLVSSETDVNTGYDPLERPHGGTPSVGSVSMRTIGLYPIIQPLTMYPNFVATNLI